MRIYLVGFMGAGKSTIGRLLAKRLDRPWADLDRQVAERCGRPVWEILARDGEAVFRDLESELLAESADVADIVLATGGGVMIRQANRRFIRRHGVSVWLRPPFEELLQRVQRGGRRQRPLFGDEEQARALYESRLELYRQADLEVPVMAGEAAAVTVGRVVGSLEERPCAT